MLCYCTLCLIFNAWYILCHHRRLSQRPTTEELEQRNILKRECSVLENAFQELFNELPLIRREPSASVYSKLTEMAYLCYI